MASVRKLYPKGHPKHDESPWIVEYTDDGGTRRRKTPKSGLKKDADAIRKNIEREQAEGVHLAASKTVTLSKLIAMYREHADAKHRDGRIGKARIVQLDIAFRAIEGFLGKIKLTDLQPENVEKFYEWQVGECGLQPNTARHRVYNIKLLEDYATKRHLMVKSPVAQALKELRGGKRTSIRVFNRTEVLTLLKTAGQRGYKRRPLTTSMTNCMVNLATFCGLRYGEIIGLRLENVDLDARMLRIRHSFCRYTEKLKSPKTRAGVRDVPMPAHVAVMVREWIELYRPASDADLVFVTTEGKWLQQSNFRNNNWLPLLKRAGLDEGECFHFHSLRHFAASWMIENGLPMTEVARLLGHAKFDMTLQVYAHPVEAPDHARAAMDLSATRLLAAPITIEHGAYAT